MFSSTQWPMCHTISVERTQTDGKVCKTWCFGVDGKAWSFGRGQERKLRVELGGDDG